jgi:exosortase
MTERAAGAVAVPVFRRTTAWFIAYVLCVLAANIRVLGDLFRLSGANATDSHLLLIPFVTVALVFQSRESIFSSVRPAVRSGAGLILLGIGLAWAGSLQHVSGSRDDALSLMVLALVVLWLGGFLFCYGWDACRAALFPLLFLAFMIPMPTALLDAATFYLKTGSRDVVSGLFTLTGTLYHREGFIFTLPAVAIEIADECSGIRSSIALLLTTLLAGHLFLTSGWRKALLVAVVLPLAVIKNGIRIVSLTLLAVHVDPSFLTGSLHHEGGVVFFVLALAMLAPVFIMLHKSETAAMKENR